MLLSSTPKRDDINDVCRNRQATAKRRSLLRCVHQKILELHEAARQGQHQEVQQLLAEGADVNAADSQGRTPLYVAYEGGHDDVVQLLLAARANVNAAHSSGRTPLYIAAWVGHPGDVQQLLAAGANVNAADTYGKTPLHTAAGKSHSEVVQLLLQAGANPRARDYASRFPLYYAASGDVPASSYGDGDVRSVQLLLEAWGERQIPAADLVCVARNAVSCENLATFAMLAKELQRLYPAELPQLFEGLDHDELVNAATAMAAAWASDVSSIDQQRAAVRRREEKVAQQQQALQHMIVGVAGIAKGAEQDLAKAAAQELAELSVRPT